MAGLTAPFETFLDDLEDESDESDLDLEDFEEESDLDLEDFEEESDLDLDDFEDFPDLDLEDLSLRGASAFTLETVRNAKAHRAIVDIFILLGVFQNNL